MTHLNNSLLKSQRPYASRSNPSLVTPLMLVLMGSSLYPAREVRLLNSTPTIRNACVALMGLAQYLRVP